MKIFFLYAIPVIWMVLGIRYARSLPKDGFSGVGEVFLVLVVGVVLLVTAVIYHLRAVMKKAV